jgi:hypothetical protein
MKSDDVVRQKGPLFEAVSTGLRADIIFENLPVIPEEEGKEIAGKLTGTYFRRGLEAAVPAEYRQWSLASHYLFLDEAKQYLTPSGSVVCSIGARMPWELVTKMFSDLDYTCELLVYDIKEQEELHEVAGGLAKLEREHGIEFRFFDLGSARAGLQELGATPEASDVARLRGVAPMQRRADEELKKFTLTAQEALAHPSRVGHMVYIVQGTPRPKAESAGDDDEVEPQA